LVALRKLTGFDAILRNIAGLFGDRNLRLLFLASSVRASEQQFPHLYQMMLDGAYVLDLPRVPELFITQDPTVNAMALGTDKPFIVMTTGLVDLMDEDEARFVVGHELGHVLSGHSVYRTMLYALIALAARFAVVPIAWIGLKAVIWGLEEWYRKSELSSDRAGLLACQDVPAARRALMKTAGGPQLAELSADAFLEQAREYDAVPDVRESLIKLMQMQGQTHPFAVVRFAELDRWANDGEYRDILAGNYPRRDDDNDASVGDEFRSATKSYQDSWGRSADPLIGAVRGVAGSAVGAGERLMNRFGRRDGDSSNDSDE
jgi:Zn-dependent protease with chaperone function